MAECSTVPSYAKLWLRRGCFEVSRIIPRNVCVGVVQSGYKKQLYDDQKVVRLSSREVCDLSYPIATILGRSFRLREKSLRCCCLGTLINPENAAPPNWLPAIDQMLMMVSIVLAYVAGVVPSDKSYIISGKMSDDAVPANTSSGSVVKSDYHVNIEYAWDEVKRKILGALDAVQHDGSLHSGVVGYEKYRTDFPLSLNAIAEGPRLRLLWATLLRLEKEVNNISESLQNVDNDGWLAISSEIIEKSSQPVCAAWLQEEFYLENKKHDREVLSTIIKKLKGDENILKNIKNLGKEDLYADILFVLRFHSLRVGCLYERKLLATHGVDILEDLVISLAEGITSKYLEFISVDSNMSGEMNLLGLNLCSLSTRALQKLRNEVALKQWMLKNMESVVSMYEDRYELFTFCVKTLEVPNKSHGEKLPWWKKLTLVQPASACPPLRYVVINPLSMSVKRTRELRALNGWRYYFSLFLEFGDIAMPMVRAIIAKVSNAVSFLLVSLIGRSLGLVYTGIRQSLRWR